MLSSIYSLSSADWVKIFRERGYSTNSLHFWLDGLYKDTQLWDRHVSGALIDELKASFCFNRPIISKILEASDGTIKFQVRFADHLEVETVLIPFYKRYTVCLSTQVGCGMNCSFCFTGTQGLKRNLTAGEIVGQYLIAYEFLLKKQPQALKPSIVFMGQGEPLHNVSEVRQAVEVLSDTKILGIGHRQITLSTVGYIPGLETLQTFPKINIALSLHSPFQEQRAEIIPIGLRYPLNEVLEKLDQLPLLKRQFITYEYLLMKDYNMSDAHVDELACLLGHRRALLNLIPFNPFPGAKWERPSDSEVENFKQKLVAKKLRVMVRTTKGDDILAACGQLKINKMARKYVAT